MKEAIIYIDGYNFYYAIKNNPELPDYLAWCDFRKLAETHFPDERHDLFKIKYFTVPVGRCGHFGEKSRQRLWMRAVRNIERLEILSGFDVKHGNSRTEKMTDVNIAVEMIIDAFREDECDRMVLLSGDIDIAPAAITVSERVGGKRFVDAWIQPGIRHKRWEEIEQGINLYCMNATREMMETSRLPDDFTDTVSGSTIHNISQWRKQHRY